ncbi:MAG: DUF5667 domain-containing protein [Pseudonocardiaceae bacterium]
MRTTRTSGGPGPDGPERSDGPEHDSFVRAESFARAVDSGLRRTSDAALTRELAVVAALRHGAASVGPDQYERDRMRQRLMAEFSSVVHDGNSPVLPLRGSGVVGRSGVVSRSQLGGSRRAASGRRHRRVPEETRGRFVVAAAAALCLLMSLSGMSLLLSREALPGDPLYTFKRSAESAELGLTFGDESKALKHLEFASARVNEIEVMAKQADTNSSWSSGEHRFLRALDDFEQDTTAGTRLLTTVATDNRSDILPSLRGWAEQQETRLQAVRGALPLTASTRLDSTLELLDRVVGRVTALDRRADCTIITSGAHDDLGLLPARGACESASSNGTSTAAPLPEVGSVPEGDPISGLVPPGLLATPSGAPIAEPAQSDQLDLPATTPDGVLPTAPGGQGADPSRPALGDPSAPPALPLPLPGLPLMPLLPLEDPHVE